MSKKKRRVRGSGNPHSRYNHIKAEPEPEPTEVKSEQISRLEKALEGIIVVDHKPEYKPVGEALADYRRSGLTRDNLRAFYKGIYDGLTFIIHVANDNNYLKEFIESKKYLPTMHARVEYMDALVDFTHTTATQRQEQINKQGTDSRPETKGTYMASDLCCWETLRTQFNLAVEYMDGSRVFNRGWFTTAVNDAYRAARNFCKKTSELADHASDYLFPEPKL
ncbi:MAG: hypothetical protein KKC75_07265 [Nanoarchaeota archaeon]|nr:hypothetical protein [Nanoarchaeota archaeon]MBU1004562.1 hypothetical protein [Nanoarchaeota archaeon]MBU1946585.1 hypothetical protein [Nanoarchaeota archaeon]